MPWFVNKVNGVRWEVSDPETIEDLLKNPDFEPAEGGTTQEAPEVQQEQKSPRKKG